jgi:hypothetical protein
MSLRISAMDNGFCVFFFYFFIFFWGGGGVKCGTELIGTLLMVGPVLFPLSVKTLMVTLHQQLGKF